ncbi:MAG TPA: DUF2934 domain-containing protein [Candidatus Acidoferrum sp.]|nr:DUF2934 domain-containing protein [Candidatus Acidoferrum sp.]
MERRVQKCRNNWIITVESRNEQHQEIIQSTVARRAYQLFEQRGGVHGLDLDDWIAAEKELLCDDFNGNSSAFHFVIECPRNPDVTTILSLTTHSLVVLRSHARHVGEAGKGPDVLSVHVLPEEIDPTQADVKPVNGLLHVLVPKKNHSTPI